MYKIIKNAAIGLALCSIATASIAMPTEITFSNNTDLALDTSVAGLPGNGITANETKAVGYNIVVMGCSFANAMTNCPIVFYNRANGDKVASVSINVQAAELTEPPTFYGQYGDNYEVSGWDDKPISHISINSKG